MIMGRRDRSNMTIEEVLDVNGREMLNKRNKYRNHTLHFFSAFIIGQNTFFCIIITVVNERKHRPALLTIFFKKIKKN